MKTTEITFGPTVEKLLEAAGRFGDPVRLVRFLFIGIVATATYALLASFLVRVAGRPAVEASLVAYSCSSLVSYFGHRRLTFGDRGAKEGAPLLYVLLTAAGFGIALICPLVIVDRLGLPIELSVLATAIIVPTMNYLVMDRLLFARRKAGAGPDPD